MKKWILLLAAIPLLATTCQREDVIGVNENYIVFGHYYGFCGGEGCIEIFKIDNETIYEDQRDEYPGNKPYEGDWKQINKEIAISTEELTDMIPDTLFSQKNKTFGTPDAYDQGGQYLEVKVDGNRVFWRIDMDTTNIPAYLHEMHGQINELVNKLQ